MGYTHYWAFKAPKKAKGNADKAEKLYLKAITDCTKVIKSYYKEHKGTDLSLAGFSAHCKNGKYGGLDVNGKGDLGHENLYLLEHFRQAVDEGFQFCKTAEKPYDIVVVACLAILKYRLKDLIDVSSDGDATGWNNGVELARQVLKLKIDNPIEPSQGDLKLVA